MIIEMLTRFEVLQKIRGYRIPSSKTIASKLDKSRRNERKNFRQNRHRMEVE